MILLELIGAQDGRTMYVNGDFIVAIQQGHDKNGPLIGVTAIAMSTGIICMVKGSPDTIAARIEDQAPRLVKWTPKGEGMQ